MLKRTIRRIKQVSDRSGLFWLNRHLAIGELRTPLQRERALEAGVASVIVVGNQAKDAGAAVRLLGMRYLGIHLEGRGVPNPEELHLLASWAAERIESGGRVLIADSQRRNNDGLVAAATLVKGGLPAHLSLTALQRARPGLRLDFTQSVALVRYAASQRVDAET